MNDYGRAVENTDLNNNNKNTKRNFKTENALGIHRHLTARCVGLLKVKNSCRIVIRWIIALIISHCQIRSLQVLTVTLKPHKPTTWNEVVILACSDLERFHNTRQVAALAAACTTKTISSTTKRMTDRHRVPAKCA